MSNYADYFGELASKGEMNNTIDFGTPINHKYNRASRNYLYTHPNQLRTMKTQYTKQTKIYDSGKTKPFVISETENLNKTKTTPKDKPNTNDELLQKLVNKGLAKVHNKQKPIPSGFKPKVDGELPPEEVYKMSPNDRMMYAKNMATKYRDNKLGSYSLPPNPNEKSVKPKPPPPEEMRKLLNPDTSKPLRPQYEKLRNALGLIDNPFDVSKEVNTNVGENPVSASF